jgi:hypothetical protein
MTPRRAALSLRKKGFTALPVETSQLKWIALANYAHKKICASYMTRPSKERTNYEPATNDSSVRVDGTGLVDPGDIRKAQKLLMTLRPISDQNYCHKHERSANLRGKHGLTTFLKNSYRGRL